MKILISILILSVSVFAGNSLLNIKIEPVLNLNLPESDGTYAIQATRDLSGDWTTLTNVPSGVYRAVLTEIPDTLFFRIQYMTNTIPESIVPEEVNQAEVTKNAPPIPNS